MLGIKIVFLQYGFSNLLNISFSWFYKTSGDSLMTGEIDLISLS